MLFRKNNISIFLMLMLVLTGCASRSSYGRGYTGKINDSDNMHKATMRPYVINGKKYYPTVVSVGDRFSGIASWYGPGFHGKKTSNGETYNKYALTAAHKTLPMNTMVKVTNLRNNRSLVVRINDRGPFVEGRIIDLSYTAAIKLDVANAGTAPVRLEVVGFRGNISKRGINRGNRGSENNFHDKTESFSNGSFLVQIGAFRRLEGAKIYKDRLSRKYNSYKPVIKRSFHNGDELYRVYLRGFRSEEEARDFIKGQNLGRAFITSED